MSIANGSNRALDSRSTPVIIFPMLPPLGLTLPIVAIIALLLYLYTFTIHWFCKKDLYHTLNIRVNSFFSGTSVPQNFLKILGKEAGKENEQRSIRENHHRW